MEKVIITAFLGAVFISIVMLGAGCSGGGDEIEKNYYQLPPQGPPETTIYSGPEYYSDLSYAQFLFGCNLSGCSFECELDSAGFAPCSPPVLYELLSAGLHSFAVRAVDGPGNVDPTPASYTWTIDITPPDTQLTGNPPDPTNLITATFTFDCTGGPCTYECQIDAGGWSGCVSPKNYSDLTEGSHTFDVRALDAAGNPDPTPPSYTWNIDLTPPETTITSGPPNPTNQTTATFTFTCNEEPCTFECQLDAGGFSSCASGIIYNSLADGSHAFEVRATDLADNTDLTPAAYTWTIDVPPLGMAVIPAGCFNMGDAFSEGYTDELPVHNVCMTSSFYMDVTEVTNAAYKACVDAGSCTAPAYSYSYTRGSYYGNVAYDNFPVIYVSWNQATAYCAWAGKRLPTEAEWEYAARGGLSGKRYPWGDTISGADANYWNSGDPWDNDTSLVEYYAASGYGLYDMAGNVWEWVNDWHSSTYYSESPTNDPSGPTTGTSRVLRGGSWVGSPDGTYDLRVSLRDDYDPTFQSLKLGFRCAGD